MNMTDPLYQLKSAISLSNLANLKTPLHPLPLGFINFNNNALILWMSAHCVAWETSHTSRAQPPLCSHRRLYSEKLCRQLIFLFHWAELVVLAAVAPASNSGYAQTLSGALLYLRVLDQICVSEMQVVV